MQLPILLAHHWRSRTTSTPPGNANSDTGIVTLHTICHRFRPSAVTYSSANRSDRPPLTPVNLSSERRLKGKSGDECHA